MAVAFGEDKDDDSKEDQRVIVYDEDGEYFCLVIEREG
jgi:hypothetical protein